MKIVPISQSRHNARLEQINKIFEHHGLSHILIQAFTKRIQEALEGKNIGRKDIALDFLHRISSKSPRETHRSNHHPMNRNGYTLEALASMKQLGLSDQVLEQIIDLLFDKRFNYYNVEEKIKSMYGSEFITIDNISYFIPHHNAGDNFNNNIGGVCQHLSVGFKELFSTTILPKIRQLDPNAELVIVWGNDRTHFVKTGSSHVYCMLTIKGQKFIIDPSFGEINIESKSEYKTKKKTRENAQIQHMNTSQKYDPNIVQHSHDAISEWTFLGLLKNQDYQVDIGFTKNKTNTFQPVLRVIQRSGGYLMLTKSDTGNEFIPSLHGGFMYSPAIQSECENVYNHLVGMIQNSTITDLGNKKSQEILKKLKPIIIRNKNNVSLTSVTTATPGIIDKNDNFSIDYNDVFEYTDITLGDTHYQVFACIITRKENGHVYPFLHIKDQDGNAFPKLLDDNNTVAYFNKEIGGAKDVIFQHILMEIKKDVRNLKYKTEIASTYK